MTRFNYQMKNGNEFWVCEKCKKVHGDLILRRLWILIDKKEADFACEQCEYPDHAAHAGLMTQRLARSAMPVAAPA